MQKRRRLRPEQSKALIFEAAERLIASQGAASLTVRGIAAEAGMNPSLVRYYYESTEDLLIAFFRQMAEEHSRKVEEALCAPHPLRALWNLHTRAPSGLLTMEIMSLGHRYENIREELVRHMDAVRKHVSRALQDKLSGEASCFGTNSPSGAAFIFLATAAALIADRGIGIHSGNAQAEELVECWLDKVEGAM